MSGSDAAQRVMSGAAWEEFCRALEQAGKVITSESAPRDLLDRAEGFRLAVAAGKAHHGDPHQVAPSRAGSTSIS